MRIPVLFAVLLLFPNVFTQAKPSDVVRFDFESGDLAGWRIVEGRFDALVTDRDQFHAGGTYNKEGKYYMSSVERSDGKPGDPMTGVVESPVFVLSSGEISLLVGGGAGPGTYIALCRIDGEEVLHARGKNTERMQRIRWDASAWVGQKMLLRLVDRSAGGWGHITLDDFHAEGRFDDEETQKLAKRREVQRRERIYITFVETFQAEARSLRDAIEDLAKTDGARYPNGASYLERLDEMQSRIHAKGSMTNADARDAFIADFRKLQREALITNPLVSGQPILFVVRHQYKPDHHNTATMFLNNEINTASFQGPGAMRTIDFAQGGKIESLIDLPEGVVRDPELHFDGKRIVFSMRRNRADEYSIYEMSTDGTGLRSLTGTSGVADIDPLYLADDRIAFTSTREPKYCMCNRHIMGNLFVMEPDGANIHQIAKSTLHEGHGALLPDGRILYDRWEYVDRNFGDAQGLWTVNPDGTNSAIYWGNNTSSPGGVIDARPIPGTQQALCIFGSCHDRPWGALTILDRRRGIDGSAGVIRTWPPEAVDWVSEEGTAKWDVFMRVPLKYEDPYPLSDKYFLASRMIGEGEQTGIFLIDVFGNELLLHTEAPGCYDPMPLGPRVRPQPIPARRDFKNEPGAFYVVDVYEGTHMEGVSRGDVKKLRVVESPEKQSWTHTMWGGQGTIAPGMNWHSFINKRILGTVPVEEDGSAYFETPSDTFVFFQLLDENGMMIQSMRSGTIVQSREATGCIGCHDERRTAPSTRLSKVPKALLRPPSRLEGWYGPARNFSYTVEVQPVFDRHCVKCHDFGKEAGHTLILASDRTQSFNASYNELWRKKIVNVVGAGPSQIRPARSWGSHASRLSRVILGDHQEVRLSDEEKDRIITWMDINAPYYPYYESAYPDNLAGRSPLSNAQLGRLGALTGVPFLKLATHQSNRGPMISYDRPEISPCLQGLREKDEPKYNEALEIIRAGQAMLTGQPRADMADFQASPHCSIRNDKYAVREKVEQRNRDALANGRKAYDDARDDSLQDP